MRPVRRAMCREHTLVPPASPLTGMLVGRVSCQWRREDARTAIPGSAGKPRWAGCPTKARAVSQTQRASRRGSHSDPLLVLHGELDRRCRRRNRRSSPTPSRQAGKRSRTSGRTALDRRRRRNPLRRRRVRQFSDGVHHHGASVALSCLRSAMHPKNRGIRLDFLTTKQTMENRTQCQSALGAVVDRLRGGESYLLEIYWG